MSRLGEYIKMVKSGFSNIENVVEGVSNTVKMEFGTLSDDEQEEITRRRLICHTCPFMSTNAVKLNIYTTNRSDEHCMHCFCPISTKTASLNSNCGIESFNKKHPEAPLDLKWTLYKTEDK